MFYLGNGLIYDSNVKSSKSNQNYSDVKISTGDTIIVSLDLDKKLMQIFRNEEEIAFSAVTLGDFDFVPCVDMYHKSDKITLLEYMG